jgi:hypothetical protein
MNKTKRSVECCANDQGHGAKLKLRRFLPGKECAFCQFLMIFKECDKSSEKIRVRFPEKEQKAWE